MKKDKTGNNVQYICQIIITHLELYKNFHNLFFYVKMAKKGDDVLLQKLHWY